MSLKKYEKLVFNGIEIVLHEWDQKEYIYENELFRFLSMLADTGDADSLKEVCNIANEKLRLLSEHSNKTWRKSEWQKLLIDLIYLMQNFKKVSDEATKNTGNQFDKEFILIIDNDVKFITSIKTILEKQGYTVLVATNGKRGMDMIYDLKPALIFIDIDLPDMDGFTILKNIVKTTRKMHVATILVGEDDREEIRIRAYELGAMDFIAKPINENVFVSFVKNRLDFKNEIEKSIIIDDLTQLYNRKYLNSEIERQIEIFKKTDEHFSLVLLDVDHFKKVNDTYGHIVGDEVLQGLAKLLMKLKRDQDYLFRYGGEEFAMLLPLTSKIEVASIVNKMREQFAKKQFIGNNTVFSVTFSAGVVQSTEKNLHREQLLDEADQALYFAKKSGRNQVKIYNENDQLLRDLTKINIIIIDDDFVTRKRIVMVFEEWDIGERFTKKVLEFSSGMTFLKSNWYNENEKYMILLDGTMPELDGFALLKIIKEKFPSKNVLVSMLTGLKGKEYVVRALEGGAVDYILKPFDDNELRARVSRLIERMFTKKND